MLHSLVCLTWVIKFSSTKGAKKKKRARYPKRAVKNELTRTHKKKPSEIPAKQYLSSAPYLTATWCKKDPDSQRLFGTVCRHFQASRFQFASATITAIFFISFFFLFFLSFHFPSGLLPTPRKSLSFCYSSLFLYQLDQWPTKDQRY